MDTTPCPDGAHRTDAPPSFSLAIQRDRQHCDLPTLPAGCEPPWGLVPKDRAVLNFIFNWVHWTRRPVWWATAKIARLMSENDGESTKPHTIAKYLKKLAQRGYIEIMHPYPGSQKRYLYLSKKAAPHLFWYWEFHGIPERMTTRPGGKPLVKINKQREQLKIEEVRERAFYPEGYQVAVSLFTKHTRKRREQIQRVRLMKEVHPRVYMPSDSKIKKLEESGHGPGSAKWEDAWISDEEYHLLSNSEYKKRTQ